MDYQAEIAKVKQQGKEARLPLYEKTYMNFTSLRQRITDHIRGLEDHDAGAATADQISTSIDDLLTLMQVMTSQAEHDEEFKAFLDEKHFFGDTST